ncbi:NAD(P)H-binding protein [Fluviicola sp.]|uniref:NAD(P)-dependent oxidoreductase n=1 Tax=Fluviicola sp. TaxID=1917219 RepID=UPI002607095D|nr:NAD(P)H-binding protein [Fluviicola sp.]
MNKYKIAVIGGTGKSGTYLVNELLKQGYSIKLLHRNPSSLSISDPLIELVSGDARNSDAMETLLSDCNAVVSTLGQPKGEPTIFSQATENILQAMIKHGIRRYIVTTGLNVDVPGDHKNEKVRFATDWMYQNYPETTKDKQVEFECLSKSNLDWTLVRLPMIIQTDDSFPVAVSLEDCPGEQISASDLARFLIDQLSDEKYIRKSPFIANS